MHHFVEITDFHAPELDIYARLTDKRSVGIHRHFIGSGLSCGKRIARPDIRKMCRVYLYRISIPTGKNLPGFKGPT